MNLERVMEEIRVGNEIHLEEGARLLMEIGGYGVGGIELGVILLSGKIEPPEEYEKAALESVIGELWQDSCVCYINRRFRACVILLACLIEAVFSLEMMKKGEVSGKGWTLGRLITYCRKNKIVPRDVFEAAKEVNDLRKIAVHLKIEREEPMKAFSHSDLDEIVPMKAFRKPPVVIHKNGSISGDDVLVVFGIEASDIVYKFKKAAMKAYKDVKAILTSLYGLRFNQS